MNKYKNILNGGLLRFVIPLFIISCFSVSTNIVSAQTSSSCQHISGSGSNKIVFTAYEGFSTSSLQTYTADVINGLKTIDPYAANIDKFSFFIDTKLRAHTADSSISPITDSSCGPAFKYIRFDNSRGSSVNIMTPDIVNIGSDDCITPSIAGMSTGACIGHIAAHELGHAIGNLADEYPSGGVAPKDTHDVPSHNKNCTDDLNNYKSTVNNKMYGLSNVTGCRFSLLTFRPSQNSIMKHDDDSAGFEPQYNKFNVISCGYIMAGINREPIDKAHAETYWPKCCNLNTVKDGIPGCSSPLTITLPPQINCPATETFTNSYIQSPSTTTDFIISSPKQPGVLTKLKDFPGEINFFKINDVDVSKDFGDGHKYLPGGQLATVPVNTPIKFETLDSYCRTDNSVNSLVSEIPFNSKAPISSIFGYQIGYANSTCAIISANGEGTSPVSAPFTEAIINLMNFAKSNYYKDMFRADGINDIHVPVFSDSASTDGDNIKLRAETILGLDYKTKILVAAHSLAAIGAFNHPYTGFNKNNVSYLLYDPPYNFPTTLADPPAWLSGNIGEIAIAKSNGIASSSKVINWTNGYSNNDYATTALHNQFINSPSSLSKIFNWIISNCPNKTNFQPINFEQRTKCASAPFLNSYTQPAYPNDIILTIPNDIKLPSVVDDSNNFFKINDVDVSVDDGAGGRKIPAGDLMTVPANTAIKLDMKDNYCRTDDITLSLQAVPVTLSSPFACFFNCQ
jgi:hypothetical protein